MSNDNGDLPAEPIFNSDGFCTSITNLDGAMGLTKREHFAAMAMQGLMSRIGVDEEWNLKEYSNTAVEAADALLAALEGESS